MFCSVPWMTFSWHSPSGVHVTPLRIVCFGFLSWANQQHMVDKRWVKVLTNKLYIIYNYRDTFYPCTHPMTPRLPLCIPSCKTNKIQQNSQADHTQNHVSRRQLKWIVRPYLHQQFISKVQVHSAWLRKKQSEQSKQENYLSQNSNL